MAPGLPCPLRFPGCFFPALAHLRAWLAPSPCPPLRAHAVSITAASGNFSRRLPASDSRAQGTLPPSGSRGPPVLSLTPSSLLRQPPPSPSPLFPTVSPSPALPLLLPAPRSSRGRSWHPQRLLCRGQDASPALLFHQRFSPACSFTCTTPTYRGGDLEEGTAAREDLPGDAEHGRERKRTWAQAALSQPHKTVPSPSSRSSTPSHAGPPSLGAVQRVCFHTLQQASRTTSALTPCVPPVQATPREQDCTCQALSFRPGKRVPAHGRSLPLGRTIWISEQTPCSVSAAIPAGEEQPRGTVAAPSWSPAPRMHCFIRSQTLPPPASRAAASFCHP